MKTNKVFLFFSFLFFSCFAVNANSEATKQPSVMQENMSSRFNNPLKYAFVTENKGNVISVIDVFKNEFVDKIILNVVPEITAVSPKKRILYYAQIDQKKLHYLSFASGEKGFYEMEEPIKYLSVRGDSNWFAYANDNNAIAYNVATKKTIEIDTKGPISFVFQPNSDNKLFIAELSQGKLSSINLDTEEITIHFELSQPISALSFMPNGLALYFNSNEILYRYGLLDNDLTKFDFGGTEQRPYVSSDSRKLLTLLPKNNELISFNTYRLIETGRYKLSSISSFPDNIASGWLEQIGVVAGKSGINSIDFNTKESHNVNIENEIHNIIVHPNSKTMYATLVNSPNVIVFDIRTKKIISNIDTHLSNPNRIIMLQSHTLCH